MSFTHLHVHSHYSILDGMSKVPDLIDKCMKNGMRAMALTDHGNMFGIKDFVDSANKTNGKLKKKIGECKEEILKAESKKDAAKIAQLKEELEKLKKAAEEYVPFKPIIGIEAYCAHENFEDEELPGHEKKRGWHLILLAKNKKGYQNLCKLSSLGFTKGYYFSARIDKKSLEEYHEGLICTSACLGGELPQKVLAGDLKGAEETVKWFKNLFGEDYYIELQRHKTDKPNAATDTYEKQMEVEKVLVPLARKYDIKLIATNDVHFVEEEHGEAHDRLICNSTKSDFDDPKRLHYSKQEWLKSPEEMEAIFGDLQEALDNTQEIVDKVEVYSIDSDAIMPKFPIPVSFGTEEEYRKKFTEQELFDEFTRNEKGEVIMSQEAAEKKIQKMGGYDKLYRIKLEADYLAMLAWEGAHKRYGETLTKEQHDQIEFELHVMKTMGFPGYFLIVQDYIRAAREELGVSVGPGRGSAAGSVVAYCLKITDIDPLKYDLLFERFLNPDRISLPDIDVDFDDEGRGLVLDWVTKKYGYDRVAHIITYGVMAAKSAIADICRVQKIDLKVSNRIKELVPKNFEACINPETGKRFGDNPEVKMPEVTLANCYKYVDEFKKLIAGESIEGVSMTNEADRKNIQSMLHYASELENTNRQIGIHACGVIIGADDLTKFAPMCTIEDKAAKGRVVVTQYDGHVIESVGLIKMDFLGLSTLSLIKEAISNVKKSRGIDVDIDAISLEDELTYKLFCDGQTIGVFQFESPGMQKHLRSLQPTVIGDLIAMNALYRPGPMDNIPSFINRKQGVEEIKYDLPCMEKYLKDTYGITVYQEQVMLLSREIADFTRGESDTLRKAMGKKQIAKMEELYEKFMRQGVAKQCKENPSLTEKQVSDILTHIWDEWKKFASYAFNKSHAACYAWVAYQTAYLKAHYPAEYMAANLTQDKDDITKVGKFMDECREMRLEVKGPDINESDLNFTVNKNGVIRFGLGGIKGVGEGAVEAIVEERRKNGAYKDIYDFVERVSLTACNRKAIESMAYAGCFDSLGIQREQFFTPIASDGDVIDLLIRYGNKIQNEKASQQASLFGDDTNYSQSTRPTIPPAEEWTSMHRLKKEKEVVSIYLSAHPLDKYRIELEHCCVHLNEIDELIAQKENKEFYVGGIVTKTFEGQSKKGNFYSTLTLEDYSGSYQFSFFGSNHDKFRNFLQMDRAFFIRCKIQERGADRKYFKHDDNVPAEWELKVLEIINLDNIYQNILSHAEISLYIDTFNNHQNVTNVLSAIENYLISPDEEHKHRHERITDLFISIYVKDNANPIRFHSQKKVIINQQFIADIKDVSELELKLIGKDNPKENEKS